MYPEAIFEETTKTLYGRRNPGFLLNSNNGSADCHGFLKKTPSFQLQLGKSVSLPMYIVQYRYIHSPSCHTLYLYIITLWPSSWGPTPHRILYRLDTMLISYPTFGVLTTAMRNKILREHWCKFVNRIFFILKWLKLFVSYR